HFDGDGVVSREEFIILMYQFMNSNVRVFKSYGRDSVELKNGGTVLSVYHKIVAVDGYVESNDHSTIRSSQTDMQEGFVKIDGVSYKEPANAQKGMKPLGDYLGYYVRIYVSADKNDKYIYGYETIDNSLITIDAADVISFKEFCVTAYSNSKSKAYKLSRDYQIIYNGVAANDCTENDLLFTDGKIELVKSAGNSDYNLVYVWKTEYVVVDTFISDGSIVTDKNEKKYGRLQKQTIKLDDEDVIYDFVTEEDGFEKACNVAELSKYPTLAMWISRNDGYIKVKGFENYISGSIDGSNTTGIEISGVEYELSGYASDINWNVTDEKQTVFLTETGKVLCAEGEGDSTMKYGYFMKYDSNGGFGECTAYVLKANGEKAVLTFADRIIIDSTPYNTANAVKTGILDEFQVVRYTQSSNGEINRIDTAQTDMLYEKNMDPYDNLRNYGNRGAQWYGQVNSLYPDLRISSAIVFNVPTKLKNDKANYSFDAGDFFVEGLPVGVETRVDVDVYDITEDRDCKVMVRYNDANPENSAPELTEGSPKAVVDSVVTALNEDGDIVRKVTLVQGSHYKEYYFSSLLDKLFTQENKIINPGDIVRFSNIGNTLTNIRVEFNAREWGMDSKLDSGTASSYISDNGSDGTLVHYAYGTLHHFNNGSFVIKRDNGNLYLVSDASATVMYYSKKANCVKPLSRSELLSISNSNEDIAHRIVAVTRYFKETHIVVFYGD
ncbi:MAG: hypothetical protein IKV88_04040, partial [Clostridia bacterium]|nr:hypothetical protein [Clostridia bacterium]